MKCWRHKDGFFDRTDRLRLRPDGRIELVDKDGSCSIHDNWSVMLIEDYCRNHDWEECPDRLRDEPAPELEPVAAPVVRPRKRRKRDCIIKWNRWIYRVRVTSEDQNTWTGNFKSFYDDTKTWSEWQGTGCFPKETGVILARI